MNDARYAYHEAGHAVAAAVLEFSFRSSGIHIDQNGQGVAQIVCPPRRCSKPFTALQTSQARMVIVLFAGLLAQKLVSNSQTRSAEDDDIKIEQYLGAIYRTDETAKSIARNYLEQEANRLVNAFEGAIRELGESLWSREYTPRTEDWGSAFLEEKTMDTHALGEVLKEWGISCKIDDRTGSNESGLSAAAD